MCLYLPEGYLVNVPQKRAQPSPTDFFLLSPFWRAASPPFEQDSNMVLSQALLSSSLYSFLFRLLIVLMRLRLAVHLYKLLFFAPFQFVPSDPFQTLNEFGAW